MTEFHRKEIREARLIANPGCYPTGTLLGTLPLISRDLVDPSSIIVDAKSGTTGARRTAQIEQLFAEVNDNFRAYKVGNHRHAPEMEQEIAATLGREVPLMFVPHLLPLNRGILSSIFLRPRGGTTTEDVRAAFEAAYPKARFIRLLTAGELPELKNVRATNFCEIAFVLDRRSQTLCVITAIDNLGKGAAGQAIQNLNVMLRLRRSRRPAPSRTGAVSGICYLRAASGCVAVLLRESRMVDEALFEWDEAKSAKNLRERGFDFEFSTSIFDGPVVVEEDLKRRYNEQRFVATEQIQGRLFTVVYTWCGMRRRIISAV